MCQKICKEALLGKKSTSSNGQNFQAFHSNRLDGWRVDKGILTVTSH